MELKLLWVVGFAVISWLRISYGANCNTFTTQGTCLNVDGCYWSSSQQCTCASNVTMDVIFTLDASGSIGSSSFQVALQWMADIIETSLALRSRVAFIRFATNSQILLDLKQSEAYTKSQLADLALDIAYTGGNTNTVAALEQCMSLFSAQGNPYASWVNILITDGNPYVPGGDTDVCSRASKMKSMGITTIIIGVGSSWNPANVDCLVTDSSHIIYVTSYTSGQLDTILPALTTVTCPVTYHLIISEVQLDLVSASQGSRFVEVYNPSTTVTLKDLSLYGIFEGKVTTSTSLSLPQSSYLVLYDKGAPTMISCQDCKCTKDANNWCTSAVYVPCCSSTSSCSCYFGGSSMNNNDWDITVKDTTNNIEVDGVSYDASTWPQILEGYTYSLKYVGYDNQLGSNWEQSCNNRGTPGSAPVTNCSWTCTNEQCRLNGASTASCVGSGSTQACYCDSNYYYFADRTCNIVPPPSECKAYWLKNETTNARTVQFQWNKAQTDRDHKYILTYYRTGTTDQVITSTRTKTVTDYDYSRGPSAIAGTVQTQIVGNNGVSAVSSTINCYPVTMSPSSAPTFHTPYVYVAGDICSTDRCSCNGTDLSCTGPDIVKDFVADDNKTQFITVKRFPEGYTPLVTVLWNIQYAGEYVNSTSNSTSSTSRRLLAVNGTNTNTTTNATRQDVTPSSGVLYFNDPESEESKIEFIMHKQALVVGESKYRWYILNVTECNSTNLQQCKPVYPSVLKMRVDVTGGGDAFTETKTQKEMPKWLWWLIGALVIFAAILALLGYRYWWKNKQTSQELVETEDQLENALEENELGFGKDLAVGDVQFNPMATGVPGQKKAPELFAGEMEKRNVDASNVRADVAVEKFSHREQFGQQQGMKRGGNDLAQPLLG